MATAMAFPDGGVGGRGKGLLTLENCDLKSQFSRKTLERARYVLRNNPIPEGADYPQRCLDIMAGSLSLTEAYDLTQADVKRREEEARIRAENSVKLADIRNRYPNLAVHRSNNQNRDATPGQKAMAFAMAWPEATNKGGRGKTSILEIEVSKPQITRARYVLRNNPIPEGADYPQRKKPQRFNHARAFSFSPSCG